MQIPLGVNDWEMPSENISRIRLRNMYLIDNPYSPDKISRVTRPTLSLFSTVSPDPVQGIWRQAGSLENKWLVITGSTLFAMSEEGVAIAIGPLPGTGIATFSGSIDQVLILRDNRLFSTDGVTITEILLPDGQLPGAINCIDSVFIISVKDSYRFYWLNPGEATPDPLNFASAERFPDPIISIGIISDEIWFIGTDSVEVWQPTGDQDAPYTRINGRSFLNGCVDDLSVVTTYFQSYPCLIWVTDKREVVLGQGTPTKISNIAVEEKLRTATNFRAWSFRAAKNDFYIITTDEVTLAFDLTKKTWAVWDSYEMVNWRAHLGIQYQDKVYAGDSLTGIVWVLGDGDSDEGISILREVSGFVNLEGNQEPCYNVNLRVNSGWSPSYTVQYPVELRWSDDGGFTWSSYRSQSFGLKGDYDKDITFRSLGNMFRPGREFEVRFSAPVSFRLDYATMNDV